MGLDRREFEELFEIENRGTPRSFSQLEVRKPRDEVKPVIYTDALPLDDLKRLQPGMVGNTERFQAPLIVFPENNYGDITVGKLKDSKGELGLLFEQYRTGYVPPDGVKITKEEMNNRIGQAVKDYFAGLPQQNEKRMNYLYHLCLEVEKELKSEVSGEEFEKIATANPGLLEQAYHEAIRYDFYQKWHDYNHADQDSFGRTVDRSGFMMERPGIDIYQFPKQAEFEKRFKMAYQRGLEVEFVLEGERKDQEAKRKDKEAERKAQEQAATDLTDTYIKLIDASLPKQKSGFMHRPSQADMKNRELVATAMKEIKEGKIDNALETLTKLAASLEQKAGFFKKEVPYKDKTLQKLTSLQTELKNKAPSKADILKIETPVVSPVAKKEGLVEKATRAMQKFGRR